MLPLNSGDGPMNFLPRTIESDQKINTKKKMRKTIQKRANETQQQGGFIDVDQEKIT